MPVIRIPALNQTLVAETGANLLSVLRQAGIYPDVPCGGKGTCGKCTVLADGVAYSACKTIVDRDMTLVLPKMQKHQILHTGLCAPKRVDPLRAGFLLAFDIGTTSLVCYLLDGKTGTVLANSSMLNPQVSFGADVVTRIQAALRGSLGPLKEQIREAMSELIRTVCGQAGISPEQIGVVSVVGNPAMQQLFLGISPENLSHIPFAPALTEPEAVPCRELLPAVPHAQLLIVPNISGYVGADTIACLLSTGLYEKEEITLLVDIGTNGEMVLGSKHRMIACATAAGPALEGANIRFGMRAAQGAIDHVWMENGQWKYSVLGGGKARGICGSGLIDAVAMGLKSGLINKRGRIRTEDHTLHLTEDIYLTQEDVRQLQLAKGAVCAGILLMAKQLGLNLDDIQKVRLAGAFGSFLDPKSACRIGLLPEALLDRIEIVGNAAGIGAQMLACDQTLLPLTKVLTDSVEYLELASLPSFARIFAKSMQFREEAV